MLRFIKHNLTGIDGVAIYPIISLLIFVIFFAAVITLVIRMKKKDVEELSQIPFETSENENQETIGILK
ncbi:MAG: CcoQ/FixQ family Cbb3-type cytochrome c oxidase assembly chaperone [Flavobacteriia bacterium]|nr:CcoQ/FixQ family Cbb3-type cytochrome c oxidase assembly chaperone [Flavobacteriia bacterium]